MRYTWILIVGLGAGAGAGLGVAADAPGETPAAATTAGTTPAATTPAATTPAATTPAAATPAATPAATETPVPAATPAPAAAAAPSTLPAPVPSAAPPAAPSAADAANFDFSHFDVSRPEIHSYIDQLVAQGFARDRLTALFAAAEPQPRIIDAISRSAEKTLQWWEYRARVLTQERIDAGVQLWREHKELLDQIAIEYQVAPEYLIAVLGVETRYGRVTGRYRVIDALATLAFDYPPRANYFRKELTEFLLLAREEKFDPLSIRGSYAGAMGALQFMPSSYRKFAVSEQHAPHRDLWGDWGDIFASTANYLHQFGWQYGAPVLAEAQLPAEQGLVAPEHMALNDTLGALRAHGMTVASDLPDDTPALLLAAPQQDAYGYRVGFKNFYVITRYNNSPLYAMAVYDLAQAIVQQIAQESAL
jgi:membrane-bound lytic murein transglycosylase B